MENFEPKGDGDFWKIPERYMNAVVDEENKMVRRRTLEIILAEVTEAQHVWKDQVPNAQGDTIIPEDDEEGVVRMNVNKMDKLEEIQRLIRPLMKSIAEPVERCRETGYDILSLIVPLIPLEAHGEYLPYIIPPLAERFGEAEILEPSEEVRLKATKFLTVVMETADTKVLLPYVDELIQILSHLIVDPFHLVRIASSKACSYLARKSKGVFHMSSDKLLGPLCTSITHQQFRVRCAVIECLGDVILFGNHKSISDVIPHITQRLFDSSTLVRKLAIAVSANWLMNYVDRYSYFQKLLPILLTGLSDEYGENSQLAHELWRKVGEQYLAENEDEHKDNTDFPKRIEQGPWQGVVERPCFGCRVLVWRNIGSILPGIVNDITDWADSTRIKCAQVLYQLILNSEDKITMHSDKVLKALISVINDEHPVVSLNIRKAAQLFGYFVPLSSSLPLMATSANSRGSLKVLRHVLEGSPCPEIVEQALEIGTLLVQEEICQTLKTDRQQVLVETVSTILARAPEAFLGQEEDEAGKKFFLATLTVMAMTKCPSVKSSATDVLEEMQKAKGYGSIPEYIGNVCGDVLQEIKANKSQWTSTSPHKLIFETIMSFGGRVLDRHSEAILTILTGNLGPERDPEVRLRFFSMLAETLKQCAGSASNKQLHGFVRDIVQDVLTPNLIWVAGKTAGALRTAASSCILSILSSEILPSSVILGMAPELAPALLSLLDDSTLLTRQISCQALEHIVANSEKQLTPDLINKIYPVLLKRLDDVSNEVRLLACQALDCMFRNLPSAYDPGFYRLHLTGAVTTLMVHLDDEDEGIEAIIYDALEILGSLVRKDVLEACETFRLKHRTPVLCDKLAGSLKQS